MDFAYSARTEELRARVENFMADLRELAKSEGLWNMFLPHLKDGEPGTRLTNMEYAPLAEIMGSSLYMLQRLQDWFDQLSPEHKKPVLLVFSETGCMPFLEQRCSRRVERANYKEVWGGPMRAFG